MKTGTKLDQNKLDHWLVPVKSMNEVIRVLMFGAKKYAPDNWQKITDPKQRYFNACLRHVNQWREGETLDKESGRHHLAHAVCCLLFVLWFELRGEGK
ncbi:dATP/dGTP diphosphohydrolase domain-containing protein [Algicola sagamiensis]|uniref:dATP/dGTP diphosphohydrolase domain-containing protein n=1 Tax=Algicola sagamiensis TaxID=163869 RepID=UPI00036680DE|nr:dATP/dGTP diphosphohydrolase domain-containing protein [Algicola sagamiensis]